MPEINDGVGSVAETGRDAGHFGISSGPLFSRLIKKPRSEIHGVAIPGRLIFGLTFLLLLPYISFAAAISWTGAAGDGNWFTANNWSPTQVPTAVDDVTIDGNVTVHVPQGYPSVAFNTLTLGDSAGNFAPTLKISTGASTSGNLTVEPHAILQQDTIQNISLGSIDVMSGGLITHTANTASKTAVVDLVVSGDFNLQAGASIAVSGLGYAGGGGGTSSPGHPGGGPGGGLGGVGFTTGGSGGGHGGDGGNGNGGITGGTGYDSISNPTDMGSGGGGQDAYYQPAAGGAGGGAVILSVGRTLIINGTISADGLGGGNGGMAGGGAGGTVNITAAVLSGTGFIHADGGMAGNSNGGSGGGGIIALNITGAYNPGLTLQAASGQNAIKGTAQVGGAGVISIKEPEQTSYTLILGSPGTVTQSQTPITDANFVNITTIDVTGAVEVAADNLAFPSNNGGIDIESGGNLILTANSVSGGNLLVESSGVFTQANTAGLGFYSVSVQSGGELTQTPNGSTKQSTLNLVVAGDFDLQPGASIAVDGLGYPGGLGGNPGQNGDGPSGGAGGPVYGSGGGGHGGDGGSGAQDGGPGAGAGGPAGYDSITDPTDLGSGGGGETASYQPQTGGSGGGTVILSVGGTLTIGGLISADGAGAPQGSRAGGGAGGTVNITAAALAGSGRIRANGGAASNSYGGAGGGGIIALNVTGADASSLILDASAGLNTAGPGHAGGAGLIAFKEPGQAEDNLRIGDTGVVAQSSTPLNGISIFFSTVSLLNSIVVLPPASILNASGLVVLGTADVTAASLNLGTGGMDIKEGGVLRLDAQAASGPLLVESGGVFSHANLVPLGFNSVIVQPGGALTHAFNGSTRQAILNLNVSGDFDLQAGANIAVEGMGYSGGVGGNCGPAGNGSGPGGGIGGTGNSAGGGGGGYGGQGGQGRGGLNGGSLYALITDPVELGSGGGGGYGCYTGGPGGAGGGGVILSVGGTLTLDGVINANGTVATQGGNGNGGGSGGTVNITAATLTGSGAIYANGGAGTANNGGDSQRIRRPQNGYFVYEAFEPGGASDSSHDWTNGGKPRRNHHGHHRSG